MTQKNEGSGEIVADKMEQTQTGRIREVNRQVMERLKSACPEFVDWFKPIQRRGTNLIDAAVLSSTDSTNGGVETYRVTLFTSRRSYSIVMKPIRASSHGDESGYLGATGSQRAPRAGETWTRGNDLADGPYCKKTWDQIVADILACELVRLGK